MIYIYIPLSKQKPKYKPSQNPYTIMYSARANGHGYSFHKRSWDEYLNVYRNGSLAALIDKQGVVQNGFNSSGGSYMPNDALIKEMQNAWDCRINRERKKKH